MKKSIKKEGDISFNLDLKVFPRVMVALIQAALFLLRGGEEQEVKEERVRKFLEFEAKVVEDRLAEPYKFLAQLSREMSEERQFLLISQLSDEIVDILQLADEIRRCHQLTIIQSTQPWREAENLEQAYRRYERMRKIEEILTQHKVLIVKEEKVQGA